MTLDDLKANVIADAEHHGFRQRVTAANMHAPDISPKLQRFRAELNAIVIVPGKVDEQQAMQRVREIYAKNF